MSIPTDQNRGLLSVIATARAKPGQEQALRELLESLVAPTLTEDGNITYALHQGTQDPAAFVIYENWESQAHLDAHLGAPAVQLALARLPELVDGGVTITPMARIA